MKPLTPVLDRIIHERARLLIMTYLASASAKETAFTALKDALSMTAGNLSIQLKTLEKAGLISVRKEFRDAKPFTGIAITDAGSKALKHYLDEMDSLIRSMK